MPRKRNPKTYTRICPVCSKSFTGHRPAAKYCTNGCRMVAWQRRKLEEMLK